jgi:uncharacterized protein (DUF2384 family)
MLSSVLESVSNPQSGVIEPERVAETLRIHVTHVATLTHISRNTLTRNPKSPRVQEKLGEIMRIITDAADLMGGNKGKAALWFMHQPLSGFNGKTAADLVRANHADAVRTHLQMLRDGAYA